MTLADYRTADAWHDSLELGPAIVRMTEELPDHEQTGLVQQLHQLMIELPASIAADLIYSGETRFAPYFRIVAAIELVERIYPALDTAQLRRAVEELADQLEVGGFGISSLPVEDDTNEASSEVSASHDKAPLVLSETASPADASQSHDATSDKSSTTRLSSPEIIRVPLTPNIGPTTVADASPSRIVNATAFHVQPDRQ